MGDRCYVRLQVHPEDLPKALPILEEYGPDGVEDEAAGKFGLDQMNGGGYALLTDLMRARIRFAGHHGTGDEYGPALFHGDGSKPDRGGVHPAYVSADMEGFPVVRLVGDPLEPEPDEIEPARDQQRQANEIVKAWADR